VKIRWHGYFRAKDPVGARKMIGRMEALMERSVEVSSCERYWKDAGTYDVRLCTPLRATTLDAAILETMIAVAPLGGWGFGAPRIELDGTGIFDGMLSRSGGSRIVISGIELLMFEIKGPVAADGPLAYRDEFPRPA
jgi:hypothetical protein